MREEIESVPTVNTISSDNTYSTQSNINVSVTDVIKWVYSQKCIPIPCQTKEKKPILDICKHKIFDDGREYGLFDDSYHVASSERVDYINRYWKRWFDIEDSDIISRVSIALNTDNGWNENQCLSVIDIDDPVYIQSFNVDIFNDCPHVYGKSGVKIFFFSPGEVSSGTIGNEKHLIDLYFAVPRLVFIHGEHSKSTQDNPIFYRIDGLKPIPVIERKQVMDFLHKFAVENGLSVKLHHERKDMIKQDPKINIQGKTKPILSNWSKLRITDIIPVNDTKIAHPVHGSTTGVNFSVNLKDDTWYCHRCHTGGGVLELIAMIEGIIDCSESGYGIFDFRTEKNLDRWLDLKRVLENKYKVDVLGYDIAIRQWYYGNRKRIKVNQND